MKGKGEEKIIPMCFIERKNLKNKIKKPPQTPPVLKRFERI